jgi:hypothetical protein
VGTWTIAPEGTEKSAIAKRALCAIAKRALCAIAKRALCAIAKRALCAIAKRALCAIAFMRGFANRVSLAAPKDSAGALRDRHHLWSVFFSFSASSVVLYG